MRVRPLAVFILYISVIIVCAGIFYFNPSMLSKETDIITSLYFSIITIATVGYGDIAPVTTAGKIVTATEALLGVVLIGLFLNSLWQSYTEKIASDRERILVKQQHEKKINQIKIYYQYLDTFFDSFKNSIAELTTPILDRQKNEFKINADFKFSDLRDMFGMSLFSVLEVGKPVIEIYVRNELKLINEFKYFLANFDILEFEQLNENIVAFLTISNAPDDHKTILGFPSLKLGEKGMVEFVVEQIKANHECPEEKLGVLQPVVFLYKTVKNQVALINAIEKNFSEILK